MEIVLWFLKPRRFVIVVRTNTFLFAGAVDINDCEFHPIQRHLIDLTDSTDVLVISQDQRLNDVIQHIVKRGYRLYVAAGAADTGKPSCYNQ
ncbi:unnamed protein product [Microthlaspi erraticum]|uniref:Uncharacterized protein n=1 Tax=Microthlaspi erraticum TaxID=1685480 RepID=A0A6D2IEW7_9BRAS|nr:unnamed protein product [Microthlaspi erraticum]